MATGLTKVDATTVSYDITNGKLNLGRFEFPTEITTLILKNSNPKEVFKIPNIRAEEAEDPNETLRTVKVDESCRHVTSIGDDFLCYCEGIDSLDLTPLSNVTSIGNGFLFRCEGIVSLDLAPLSNVTSIGKYFLALCTGIVSLDLAPLSNVTSIEYGFLSCGGIASLNLAPLSNVTSIGDHFLRNCDSIASLDLTPVTQVLRVGRVFLDKCDKLKEVQVLECAPPMLIEKIPDDVRIAVVSDILV